jgi:PAS domain S-box-containing protein
VVVGEGATGQDAIEQVRVHRPDLLLLDVSMPDMDGLEALPQVREVSPQTVVVMYTGFAEGGLAARARALGAAALLEKSGAIDDLPDQLTEVVRQVRADAGPAPVPAPAPPGLVSAADVLGEHVERFRELFEQAAIGMATMTLTGNIVRPNLALAEAVGRPASQLVGLSYPSIAGPEEAPAVAAALARTHRESAPFVQFEHRVETPSGERRLLATVAPVKDAGGRSLYLFLQVQDVTAQRRMEEELRQSEERFRLLVGVVQDYAIFLLDPQGRVASWNAGAERIKGYSADEIIGRHFRTFYPPEMQAIRHPEHELELALRDGHYEEEGWRVRKDGSRFWASVVITAVRSADGAHIGFTKVTRDIDERRKMVLDLEDAASALAEANENLESANQRLAREAAEQAQFLAVTAHELRSPVSVLSGSASLLADHWQEMSAEERGELFESLRLGAARLQRLLNDLLTASRLEAKRIRPSLAEVRLSDVLAASVAAIKAASPEVEVRLDCPEELLVLGEADRVGQALDNLLSNSVRHGRPPVQVAAVRRGDRVEVRVRDAGPGVDRAVQDRLFQRFATGERRGGTGLGLFIVRELARTYGGDAWYEPDANTFVLALLAAGSGVAPAPSGPTG